MGQLSWYLVLSVTSIGHAKRCQGIKSRNYRVPDLRLWRIYSQEPFKRSQERWAFLGANMLPGTILVFLGMSSPFVGTPNVILGAFLLPGPSWPFPGPKFLGCHRISVRCRRAYVGEKLLLSNQERPCHHLAVSMHIDQSQLSPGPTSHYFSLAPSILHPLPFSSHYPSPATTFL